MKLGELEHLSLVAAGPLDDDPTSAPEATSRKSRLGLRGRIGRRVDGLFSVRTFGITLLLTVILAFVMFNSLERVINFIWRVERKRPITQKFVVFYATATIGPFLIGISVVHAAELGLTDGFAGYVLSFLTLYLAVFLAHLLDELAVVLVNVAPLV